MKRALLLCCLLIACGKGAPDDPAGDSARPDSGDGGDGGAGDGGDGSGGDGSGGDGGDSDPGGGDSEAGPGDSDGGGDTGDFCDDAPTVTYNNFGQGFMTENCQGCHASTAPDRYGAPKEVIFDTVEDCWEQVDRVLLRSTGSAATMPPQGGVSDDDRTRLAWWLRCANPGT